MSKILTLAVALVITAAIPLFATDMTLTLEDGRTVILHDNNTWGFNKFTITDGSEEDIYSELNDGRILCLKTDNTWSFVKSRPPKKKEKKFTALNAEADATQATLDKAVQAASNEAMRHAVTLMREFVTKSKKTDEYLTACIKKEIGENGADVKYSPGWKAHAKITLEKYQVQKIAACVEDQIAANAPAPDTTAVKKTKKPKAAKTEVVSDSVK